MRYEIFTDPINKRTKVLDNVKQTFAFMGPKNQCIRFCDASNKADTISVDFELTVEQLIMIKCKIRDYIMEGGDVSTIKMFKGLARGFSGYKPVILISGKYSIFEAEGYPLGLIESSIIPISWKMS
jgi:hypothetical protein